MLFLFSFLSFFVFVSFSLFRQSFFLFSFILSYLSFYDFLPLVLSFFLCMLISVLSFFVLVSFSLFHRSYFLFLCYSYFLFNLPFFLIFLSIMSIWYFICYFFILLHPVFASFSSFIHFACFFFHSLLPFYFRNDSIFITFLLNFLFFHSFPFVLSQNFFLSFFIMLSKSFIQTYFQLFVFEILFRKCFFSVLLSTNWLSFLFFSLLFFLSLVYLYFFLVDPFISCTLLALLSAQNQPLFPHCKSNTFCARMTARNVFYGALHNCLA